jgi:hypothetical protein
VVFSAEVALCHQFRNTLANIEYAAAAPAHRHHSDATTRLTRSALTGPRFDPAPPIAREAARNPRR